MGNPVFCTLDVSVIFAMHLASPLHWVALASLCLVINISFLPSFVSLLSPLSLPSFCYCCAVDRFSVYFPATMRFGWFEAAALTAASVVSAQVPSPCSRPANPKRMRMDS